MFSHNHKMEFFMKRILLPLLFLSSLFSQVEYSWEDGGTILGSYGNISNPINTGSLNGVNPYDGDFMLSVSESPLDGTPKAYVAYIQNLNPGDVVTASFYTYDISDGSPSTRIWGGYATNDDINSYAGSAGGNSTYPSGIGWEQLSHTWTFEEGDDREALVIEARLYSPTSGGEDPTVFYFDLISVSAPETATINFPGDLGDLIPGCTDADACNYDSDATSNDGSCLYNDCLGDCGGTAEVDFCGICEGDGSTCDSVSLFFSEYAEGTSNNKYLEIYNPGSESVNLAGYAFPTVGNAPTTPGNYEYWNIFDSGAIIEPGDVYVICHDSADSEIQAECDQNYIYFSNGNDGMCLVFGTEPSYTILDCIGDWNGDPGDGWDVAGVSAATKDHTLVRKGSVTMGTSNWAASAGTNMEDSEWLVFDLETWTYIGSHPHDSIGEDPVANAGEDMAVSPGDTVTLDGSGSYDGNGTIISYEWTQMSGIGVNLEDEESVVTTFIAPEETGPLVFMLTVFDNDINEHMDEVTINVIGSTSIYDIQYTVDQGEYCYETSLSGEIVTTTGVVTHVKPGEYPNFFLQDPNGDTWSGIYIYDTTIMPQVGDELQVTGTVNEYYSFTQIIDVTASTLVSNGNMIDPIQVNASDIGAVCSESSESYESMLVSLSNLSFDSVDEFGNWVVSDASGPAIVDDYYFDGTFPTISLGDTFECITGVLGYSYSEFKVYPRNVADFECQDFGCTADGDANGDGVTNILDVVQVVNYILGNLEFNENQICAADMNADGGLNVLDIVQIVNQILGG